jgi:hypothetical protein
LIEFAGYNNPKVAGVRAEDFFVDSIVKKLDESRFIKSRRLKS